MRRGCGCDFSQRRGRVRPSGVASEREVERERESELERATTRRTEKRCATARLRWTFQESGAQARGVNAWLPWCRAVMYR